MRSTLALPCHPGCLHGSGVLRLVVWVFLPLYGASLGLAVFRGVFAAIFAGWFWRVMLRDCVPWFWLSVASELRKACTLGPRHPSVVPLGFLYVSGRHLFSRKPVSLVICEPEPLVHN